VFVSLQCSSGVKDPLPMFRQGPKEAAQGTTRVNDSAAPGPHPISQSEYPVLAKADTPAYLGSVVSIGSVWRQFHDLHYWLELNRKGGGEPSSSAIAVLGEDRGCYIP
jgi:hypothetical protein